MNTHKRAFLAVFTAANLFSQQTDWVSQIRNKPFLDVRQFQWTPQAPGGSLSAGSNTITMAPCPLGLNAANASTLGYRVYASGGTGAAESVPVTGGTCTSGLASGTIVVTAGNSHSGAWSVSSATGGIGEALLQIGPTSGTFIENSSTTGGVVFLPCGVYQAYSSVTVQGNVELIGSGQCSIIRAMVNGMEDTGATGNGVVATGLNSNRVTFRDFNVDMNEMTGTSAITIVSSQGGVFENLGVTGGTILADGIGMTITAHAGQSISAFDKITHLHVENGPSICIEAYGQTNNGGSTWYAPTLISVDHVRCTTSNLTANLPVIYLVEYMDSWWFHDIDVASGSNIGFQIGGGSASPAGLIVGDIYLDGLICETSNSGGECVLLGAATNVQVHRMTGSSGINPYTATGLATNWFFSDTAFPGSLFGYAGSAPLQSNGWQSIGTKFTASGCSNSTTSGGATAGSFASGTSGTCTVTITMAGATGLTAANGWTCHGSDLTHAALFTQTASTTTTATISGTTTSGDTVSFSCSGF